MSLKCEERSIFAIFNEYKQLEIPMYQRSYAWEAETVKDFVEDIEECLKVRICNPAEKRHHFFGGIVSIISETKNSDHLTVEIIDGQQRLSTFVLLVAVIVKKLESYIKKDNDFFNNKEISQLKGSSAGFKQDYVMYKDGHDSDSEEISRLKMTEVDYEVFSTIVDSGIEELEVEDDEGSHQRLVEAWKILDEFVEKYFVNRSNPTEQNVKNLKSMRQVLENDCSVIFITTNNPEDAYRYFLVLNDRGERLTTGDLLRAQTLGILNERNAKTKLQKVSKMWKNILSDRNKGDIERNIKWYYESMTGLKPKKLNLPSQYLRDVIKKREIEVNNDYVKVLVNKIKAMEEGIAEIRSLRKGLWKSENEQNTSNYDKERLRTLITNLGHTQAIPLLLAISDRAPQQFCETVSMLERFFFRYKSLGQQHAGPMEEIYRQHCEKLRDQSDKFTVRELRVDLREILKSVDDKLFALKLEQLIYKKGGRVRNDVIKVLLVSVENYWDWCDNSDKSIPVCTDQERAINCSSVTIEHIYPQEPLTEDYDDGLEEEKDKIGNLTLLGGSKNSSLGNKPFHEKKKDFKNSNFRLNRTIATQERWTKKEVRERKADLIRRALKIFVP